MKSIKPHWLFFLAVTLTYLSLSPGTISDMGYMPENIEACNQIISNLGEWATFQYASTRVSWPRHGLYELILEIPFILVGKAVIGPAPEESASMLSLQPVIFSSLLCTLLFVWVRRITGSLARAFVLGAAAAFSTMLWPYAYIGLETTQSLFLPLTAFISIEWRARKSWKHVIALSVCAGLTLSLKSNGVFLAPAVGFLGYFYFKPEIDPGLRAERKLLVKPMVAALIVLSLYLLNSHLRSFSPVWHPGTVRMFLHSVTDGWVSFFLNLISLFGSANKGFLIYSPIMILCLVALRKAFRNRPEVAAFALLTLLGLAVCCSLFYFWADETWGTRYLHSAIPPLVLALAASRVGLPFRPRAEAPLLALALVGVFISFVGLAFHYGHLHKAALEAGQSTIEKLQTDPAWNPIRFNLMLLEIRARGDRLPLDRPSNWPPEPHWWYGRPPEAPEQRSVDLRKYANPQPIVLRDPASFVGAGERAVRVIYLNFLWLGPALLLVAWRSCSRSEEAVANDPGEGRKADAAD